MTKKQWVILITLAIPTALVLGGLVALVTSGVENPTTKVPSLDGKSTCAYPVFTPEGQLTCLYSQSSYTVVVYNPGCYCGMVGAWLDQEVVPSLAEFSERDIEVVFITSDTISATLDYRLQTEAARNIYQERENKALPPVRVVRDPEMVVAQCTGVVNDIYGVPRPALSLISPWGQVLHTEYVNSPNLVPPSVEHFLQAVDKTMNGGN